MGLRNRYLVRRHCLVPLIPTTDFCNLKGAATKLNNPHIHGISVSMTKRTKGKKHPTVQIPLESNQFALP